MYDETNLMVNILDVDVDVKGVPHAAWHRSRLESFVRQASQPEGIVMPFVRTVIAIASITRSPNLDGERNARKMCDKCATSLAGRQRGA